MPPPINEPHLASQLGQDLDQSIDQNSALDQAFVQESENESNMSMGDVRPAEEVPGR